VSEEERVVEVATSLTPLQRQWLLNPEWRGSGVTQFALVDALDTKFGPPMVHIFTLRWDRLTDFGHLVRRYVQAQEQAA